MHDWDSSVLRALGKDLESIRLEVPAPPTADKDVPLDLPDATGRYQIRGEIARGGVGVILRGTDVDLGRDVAMKVIRPRHAKSPEAVRRFVEEAQVGSQLQHPGIVPVYELGVIGDRRAYFTMKLIKGRTFGAILKGRPSPKHELRRYLGIFQQVCLTIAYAHERCVIHRDLKPANIMVGAFAEVQVVDWGFSKVLTGADASPTPEAEDQTVIATVRTESEGSESRAGSIMGTPAYMPPEQALGQIQIVDERSDVFALGAMLVEILTGAPAYTKDGGNIMVQAAKGDPRDALDRVERAGVHADLIEIVKRCLAGQAERYAHAGEVAAEVGAHLAGIEARAREAERSAVQARVYAEEARKRRRIALAVSAAALLVVAIGSFAYARHERSRMERARGNTLAVERALREGERLAERAARGPIDARAAWAMARTSAARSVSMAGDLSGTALLVDRATALLARVKRGASEARTALAKRADRDRLLVALREARLRPAFRAGDDVRRDQRYRAAFLRAGIDIDVGSIDDLVQRIGTLGLGASLARHLTSWAARRPASSGAGQATLRMRLLALADRLDPDPAHRTVRAFLIQPERGAQPLIALAERLTDVPGDDPTTHIQLAVALAQSGNADRALRLLEQAERLWPGDLWVHVVQGRLRLRAYPPTPREAARSFRAAVALAPEAPSLRWLLAETLRRRGAPELAIPHIEEALRDDASVLDLATLLGACVESAGRVEPALARWSARAEADPSGPVAPLVVAEIQRHAGNASAAEDALREAVGRARERPLYQLALGQLLLEQKRYAEAQVSFELAAADADAKATAWRWRGYAYLAQGQWQAAVEEHARAAALEPANWLHAWDRSRAYLAGGAFERAEQALEEARAQGAGTYYFDDALGDLRRAQGRVDEAAAAWRRALEHDAARSDVAWKLAQLEFWRRADMAAARTAYVQAAEASRLHVPAQVMAGRLLYLGGEKDRARTYYERALGREPHAAWALLYLAAERLDGAQPDAARALLDTYGREVLAPRAASDPRRAFQALADRWLRLADGVEPAGAKEHAALALLRQLQGRHADALTSFRAAFAAEPGIGSRAVPLHDGPTTYLERAAVSASRAIALTGGTGVDNVRRCRELLDWTAQALAYWRKHPDSRLGRDTLARWADTTYPAPIRYRAWLGRWPSDVRRRCEALLERFGRARAELETR